MSRGGPRTPGPGKSLGRPPLPDGEKCIPKMVYLPPWCWSWIAERGTNGTVIKGLIEDKIKEGLR